MKKSMQMVLYVFFVILAVILILGLFLGITLVHKSKNLEISREKIVNSAYSQVSILDNHNIPLTDDFITDLKVDIDDVNTYTLNAFTSIEDKDFFNHNGINPKRMVGALINNIKAGKIVQGASTITQQLIKNTHLTSEQTYERKIDEVLLALKLEKEFSKKEIMESYLNCIYFGNGNYGLANASQNYFNKSYTDLTVAESAMMAGVIKSPFNYSPIYNIDAAIERRNLVLSEMKKDGVITASVYNESKNEEVNILENIEKSAALKNHMYDYAVRDESAKILNIPIEELSNKKLKIFTYLEPTYDQELTELINSPTYLKRNRNDLPSSAGGVMIDNKTGGIKSLTATSGINIYTMKRQPASAIKPLLVYAPAFEKGIISPESLILDEKTSFNEYSPKNVGDEYFGNISIRESVEKSLNIPAVKLLEKTGINYSKNMAEKAGISFHEKDKNLALALGGFTEGTTLLQLANSYLPFSNDGYFKKATFIKKICDENGNEIYRNPNDELYSESRINNVINPNDKVMSAESAYLVNDILLSSAEKGTSKRLSSLPFEIAAKTGTNAVSGTNYNHDAWSVAYTKDTTFATWIGNPTNEKDSSLDGSNNGGTNATSIIKDFIENISYSPTADFTLPAGIVKKDIDLLCLSTMNELVLADDDLPDRYKKTASFNSKHLDTLVFPFPSRKLNDSIDFSCALKNGDAIIKFSASPYYNYEIVRVEEDEIKTLKEINGEKGEITFSDKKINSDTLYTYYIKFTLDGSEKNEQTKKINIIK